MSNIRSPLEKTVEKFGDFPALIDDNQVITYSQYQQLVYATIQELNHCGVKQGDRVAVISSNSKEQIILLTALFHTGAIACPINPRFPPPVISTMLDSVGCLKLVVDTNLSIDASRVKKIPIASLVDLSGPAPSEIILPDIDLEQEATIIFTSGSSTIPKAVLHSFGNHYFSALGSNDNIDLQPADRWLLSLPLYHVSGIGILFRTLLSGAAIVISNEKDSLTETITEHQVTHLSQVATQLQRFLNEPNVKETITSLKAILLGGGSISEKLISKAYNTGMKLYTSYGLTEMSSQVTTTASGDPLEKLLTSGKLLKQREIKIAADGEILVRGDTLFKGYVKQGALLRPFENEGWYATGDLGHIDSDGYLTVKGRKDNMFISGGENIYPEEIEGVLSLLDNVEDVIVVPIKDKEFGHRPVAFVKWKDNKQHLLKRNSLGGSRGNIPLPEFKIPVRCFNWPKGIKPSGIKPSRQYFIQLAKKIYKD